jgi:hypothetical protein
MIIKTHCCPTPRERTPWSPPALPASGHARGRRAPLAPGGSPPPERTRARAGAAQPSHRWSWTRPAMGEGRSRQG